MRINPQLRALRGNTASQRNAQQALEDARDEWRDISASKVLEDLERYGAGMPLDQCPALTALFEGSRAKVLAETLVAGTLEALRGNPLGQVPFRHQQSEGLSVLQLAHSGRAALTLLLYSDTGHEAPASAWFSGGDRIEAVLAGAADVRFLELLEDRGTSAAIDCTARRVVDGEVMRFSGFAQTKSIERVHGRMVVLRLARSDAAPCDAREFALDDGRLLHRASGSRAESRQEMMLALLGRMGRSDAAPLIAEMTREGSDHIRWQAMRECLALDTGTGFAALGDMARNAGDPLAATAGALHAQLIETYPQLARLETQKCPA